MHACSSLMHTVLSIYFYIHNLINSSVFKFFASTYIMKAIVLEKSFCKFVTEKLN